MKLPVVIPKNCYSIESETSDFLSICLKKNFMILGIPCKKGDEVWFNKYGIQKAILFEDVQIQNIVCKKHTMLVLYRGTSLLKGTFAKDYSIGEINIPAETEVTFYPRSKKIHILSLKKNTVICGIPCRGGFGNKGYVQGADKNNKMIERLPVLVSLYKDGRIKMAELSKDIVIHKIKYKVGRILSFYKNGKVEIGVLATDQKIQELKCRGNTDIHYSRDGKITFASLSHDQIVQKTPCAGGKRDRSGISFYSNGKLERFTLARELIIKKNIFKKGTILTFNRNGSLFSAELYMKHKLEEKIYLKNTYLEFKKGKIVNVEIDA